MKKTLTSLLLLVAMMAAAQQQRFDITSYTPPAGWKKQTTESSVQFSREETAKGTYCMIMLLKAIPGTADARENFNAAWESVVKEMVKVNGAPEMQPPAAEDGWEAQSGYAAFSNNELNGIVMLVTSSGFGQMVNIIVMTNSDTYEKEISAFLGSVSFVKKETGSAKTNTTPPLTQGTNAPAKKDGFAFNTTNFDDGWTSTVQEDWVEVTKGSIKVLLHYPKQGTIFPADPEPLTNAAWNILVAPRYSNLKNYKTDYVSSYNRAYIARGTATLNATGKATYIVFFRQGETGWMEITCPDKNTFIQEYKFDPEAVRWDFETSLLEPVIKMAGYNKFAVGPGDFSGTWTSDFTGIQQLYSVYTGQYAGMNVHQSNQTFEFGARNTYKWSIVAVNGMVGNLKFDNAKSAGKFSVLNNWQVQFSNIEGKAKKYDAYFSCIKGARVLWLQDAVYKGGGYTGFGKK